MIILHKLLILVTHMQLLVPNMKVKVGIRGLVKHISLVRQRVLYCIPLIIQMHLIHQKVIGLESLLRLVKHLLLLVLRLKMMLLGMTLEKHMCLTQPMALYYIH